jgi:signal transduction histidine kinase
MRKKYILLALFLIIHSAVSSAQQNKIIDSLEDVLKKQKDDTSKVKTLIALSKEIMRSTIQYSKAKNIQGLKYGEDALLLAKQLNYKKGIADSYLQVGKTSFSDNKSEAMKNFFIALKLMTEIGNKQGLAECYFDIGLGYSDRPEGLTYLFTALKLYKEICDHNLTSELNLVIATNYSKQGNYPEALKYYLANLKIAEEFGTKTRIAAANRVLGHFYNEQGNFSQALKYYFAYYKISKEAGDKTLGPDNVIGQMYNEQGNYPEALKYFQAAFKISEETGDESQIPLLYVNIASIYRKQMRFPEALKYYWLRLKVDEKNGEKPAITSTYRIIGSTYMAWAQQIKSTDSLLFRDQLFAEALKNYQASLKISEEEEDKSAIALSHSYIAKVYRLQKKIPEALNNYFADLKILKDLGQKLTIISVSISIGEIYTELNKFSEARSFLNEALSLSREAGNRIYIKDIYEHLTTLEIASGNWEGAYQNYRMFILYRDSLINKENTEKMLRQQMQYDFDKKEDSLKYHQSLTDEKLKQQILLVQQQEQKLLLNEKELAITSNEKQLNQLQIEKTLADYTVQKTEADKRQQQLLALNKEKEIQNLEIKKQKLTKNYFIGGLVLFALISFFIYRNYRTRQQLRLQTLRNKIASDLHDDVGSTLSSISIFSQMAQQQSKEVIPLLEAIGENSRKMLDAMADIVWTINPDNDQFEKIILRMKSFAYELLGAKKIDFEFVAEDEVSKMKLPMEVRKNLYLIFKEATNNIVKYAQANKALFAIRGEKNNLMMMIKDNGKGFDINKLTEGNGLKNMKKRANEIGADLVIDSYPGNGTTIQLRIAV